MGERANSGPLSERLREEYLSAHPMAKMETKGLPKLRATLDRVPISALCLSSRAQSRLRSANIESIGQLLRCSVADLLSIWHMGQKTAHEIVEKLNAFLCSVGSTEGYAKPTPTVLNKRSDETDLRTSTISGALEYLLQELGPRQARVLDLRYGLKDGKRRTLEEIGLEFEVSRERVRQIQVKALRRLNHPSKRKYLEVISTLLENVFQKAGGILRESEILSRLGITTIGNFHPAGLFRFVLQLSSKFVEIGDEIWALAEYPLRYIPTVVENAVRLLEARRSRMRFNILVSEIKRVSSITEAVPTLDSLFIEACIKAGPEVEVMSDGWCGLTKWRTRYLDETVQVLRDEGKPLHYTVITKRVNDLLSNKRVSDHSVHALLQRWEAIFVRVEPGTYGLREWGLKSHPYYLRLIEAVLKQAGKPLAANEIIRCVSEVRPCKESTALMYLTLNERFVRLESGEFALREWLPIEQQTHVESASHLTTSFVEQLKKEAMAELWPFQNSVDSEE